jgi:hypothetical protein
MSFQRAHGGERTLVVVNYGDAAGAARVPGLPPNRPLQRLYPTPADAADARLAPARDGDAALVPAPALSVQVFQVGD